MNKKVLATIVFVMVVGGVLITFTFLGSQGGPPPMTAGAHHKLRFDLNSDLIGVETDPPLDLVNLPKVTDKRAIEKRVNEGCRQCHVQLPAHHPPKTECIKCHRMAPANAVSATGGAATVSNPAANAPATPASPPPASAPTATDAGPTPTADAPAADAGR